MWRLALLLIFGAARAGLTQTAQARSTIFYAADPRAISGYAENAALVRQMVDALVLATTEKSNLRDAWLSLVQPADRVGIKVSNSGAAFFSSHRSIVSALVDGLALSGVPRQNILVWDRVSSGSGYDEKAVVSSAIMGKLIWGDLLFVRRQHRSGEREEDQISDESHWSKALCSVTKIINVPVLGAVESCGVGGCFYNAIIPNLDNWRRFAQSPDPAFCELYRDPHLGPKVVLNVVDGLIAQFAGGPEFQPNYAWNYATIYAGRDPVALDATALREIESWRSQAQLPSLAKRATFLETAAGMGLGNSAAERIDCRKVEPR